MAGYLGEFAGDYDVPGLVAAYRAAVDAALPGDVSLCGNEFIGPYPPPAGVRESLAEFVEGVDLEPLAEQFDRTQTT